MWLSILNKRHYLFALILLLLFPYGCSSKYKVISHEYTQYEGEANQHTRIINAGADHVFRILTHEKLFQEACPKGTIVTHESPPPYQPGTLIKTQIDHIFKLEWHTQVEEVISPKKIRLRFLDGFFEGGREIWELEDIEGKTRATQTIIVHPKGIIRNIFWLLKVRMKHDKMLEAFLDNLKSLAEKHSFQIEQ